LGIGDSLVRLPLIIFAVSGRYIQRGVGCADIRDEIMTFLSGFSCRQRQAGGQVAQGMTKIVASPFFRYEENC
jgi:hypothetical protein